MQLLVEIRTALLLMSTSLLMGSLTALYWKNKTLIEARLGLLGLEKPQEGSMPGTSEGSNSRRDKRRARRYRSNLPIDLTDASGHFTANIARLMNISQAGACFYSVLPLSRGHRIRTYWHAGEGDVCMMSGRVIWHKSNGKFNVYGISFDAPLPQNRLSEVTQAAA